MRQDLLCRPGWLELETHLLPQPSECCWPCRRGTATEFPSEHLSLCEGRVEAESLCYMACQSWNSLRRPDWPGTPRLCWRLVQYRAPMSLRFASMSVTLTPCWDLISAGSILLHGTLTQSLKHLYRGFTPDHPSAFLLMACMS